MVHNLGKTDRTVRAIIGPLLLAYGIYDNNWLASIGIWLIMTVFSKWCPVYSVFGIFTSPEERAAKVKSAAESDNRE